MKPSAPLSHATLADSLNAACYAITDAFVRGTRDLGITVPGVPTTGYFDEFIPGLVYDLAVNAGWIPQPFEPEEDCGVVLGNFYVEEVHREWFISLLHESLSKLREAASKNDNDEEAGHLRREMWGALLVIRAKAALGDKYPQTLPVESVTPMPEWGEAYKAAKVPETTSDERKALEKDYLSTHKHPVYGDEYEKWELHWMANVHRKQWDRWRRCDVANNSEPGRRILDLLERNKWTKNPVNLVERKRENLRL